MAFRDTLSLRLPPPAVEPAAPDFVLHGLDVSYFTGKLECYCRYRALSFVRHELTGLEMAQLAKQHTRMSPQVPLLEDCRSSTPEAQRWLRDTTPIIRHLEGDHLLMPSGVIPVAPVRAFLAALVEDFGDEELWRIAMYYRWAPPCDGLLLSQRFAYEFARDLPSLPSLPGRAFAASLMNLRQWLFSVYGEGIHTVEQHTAVQQHYLAVLDALQHVLQQQPFVGGSHPTIADFGLAGPFLRHFSSDPTPRKILQQRAPAVYEWVGRLWNASVERVPPPEEEEMEDLPRGWERLLPLLARYTDYLALNAEACRAGKESFFFDGCEVPAVPYRAWCRYQLQLRFLDLGEAEQGRAEALLRRCGCWRGLFGEGTAVAQAFPAEGGTQPPFCHKGGPLVQLGYKWPAYRIYRRYVLRRLIPRAAVVIAIVFLLMRVGGLWGRRVVASLALFFLGRCSW